MRATKKPHWASFYSIITKGICTYCLCICALFCGLCNLRKKRKKRRKKEVSFVLFFLNFLKLNFFFLHFFFSLFLNFSLYRLFLPLRSINIVQQESNNNFIFSQYADEWMERNNNNKEESLRSRLSTSSYPDSCFSFTHFPKRKRKKKIRFFLFTLDSVGFHAIEEQKSSRKTRGRKIYFVILLAVTFLFRFRSSSIYFILLFSSFFFFHFFFLVASYNIIWRAIIFKNSLCYCANFILAMLWN